MTALLAVIVLLALATAGFALCLLGALGFRLIMAAGEAPIHADMTGANQSAAAWTCWVRDRYALLMERDDVLWRPEQYHLGARLRREEERLRTLPIRIAACEKALAEVDEPWMDTVLEEELKHLYAQDMTDILSKIWELQAAMSEMELPGRPPHYEDLRIEIDLCGPAVACAA